MFWLEILLQVLIRVPKGFRAPGLQGSGLQIVGLHSPKTLGSGLPGKNFVAPGLQAPPL